MRYVRRLIAILTAFAISSIAATSVAFAQVATRQDPGGGVIVYPPSTTATAVETPLWRFFAVAALGALLAIAVVGLISSLRHRQTSSEPSKMLHA